MKKRSAGFPLRALRVSSSPVVESSTEERLARLETLPLSLDRIERALDRVSEGLEALRRLELQQQHHSASIDRAFEAVEKLAGQCEKSLSEVGKRVADLERTAAEKFGWAKGWLSMAGTVLGIAQLVVMGMGGYLFSHLAALENAVAERSRVMSVIEQRLSTIERGRQ